MRTVSGGAWWVGLLTAAALGAGCQGSSEAAGPSPSTGAASAPAAESTTGEDNAADHSAGVEGDEPALPPPPAAAISAGAKDTAASFLAETDRELRALRSSAYEHHTSIDESAGSFQYDCSGFVDYALRGSAPTAFAELAGATVRRPLAKHFEGFFASIPPGTARGHWGRVARVSELRPGDIIAWLQPADSSSKNTGHVLVVHGALRADDTAPGAFLVPVVDSTALKHGSTDSRAVSGTTGLGTGNIVLVADASGAPVAFRWSTGRKSRVRETAIALGRINGH